MSELYMMATISDRNQTRRFLAFYREYGVNVTLLTYGEGTAASEVLDAFGLEAAEKANIAHDKVFSILDAEHRKLLEFCEDAGFESSSRENEYYYRAGIKDGVNLDRLVKQMKSTD